MPLGALLLPRGFAAPETMPIWVATAATWDHGDILDLASAKDRVWICGPATVGVCVDVPDRCSFSGQEDAPGLGHSLWPCWCCTWTKPVWLTSTVNCGYNPDQGFGQEPCLGQWPCHNQG